MISEWLGLFDCAEYVVTNSFHGTVFSILFNKSFISVPQCGEFEKQNNRISSVLEYFGLTDRIFGGHTFENLVTPIDWDTINAKLSEIRERSPFVVYAKTVMQGDGE